MAATLAVMLLAWGVAAQNTTTVYVNAIEPCTLTFAFNNSTGRNELVNCSYFLPGFVQNGTDWASCYLWCCPGLVQPATNTLDDIQSCVNTYSQTPFLVTLIGILLGLFLLLVFVCLPCCCSKDGAFARIKQAISNCLEDKGGRELVNSRDISRDEKNAELPAGSAYVMAEDPVRVPLSEELIDEAPSEERVCQVCGEGKANLRLKCTHCFHTTCLRGEMKRCHECQSEAVLPVRAYCGVCERRYASMPRIHPNSIFMCRTCQEK